MPLKYLSLLYVALRMIGPIVRWGMYTAHDGQVTYNEVVEGIRLGWPRKDAAGRPLPLNLPWYTPKA
jgi:hypothetical protein